MRWREGWSDYTDAPQDPYLGTVIKQAVLFTGIPVGAGVAGSLALAVFLNQPHGGVRLFRAICYLPCVIFLVVQGVAFQLLFNANGLIDDLSMHFGGTAVQWLEDDCRAASARDTATRQSVPCWGAR